MEVVRCHLSESIYQRSEGYGRLVGAADAECVCGFDIPCGLYPQFEFDGERLRAGQPGPGGLFLGTGCTIPYAFVRRAFYHDLGDQPVVELTHRPTDEQVRQVAQQAIQRLADEVSPVPLGGTGHQPPVG